jgi:trehalose 6-phosphate phosphatase
MASRPGGRYTHDLQVLDQILELSANLTVPSLVGNRKNRTQHMSGKPSISHAFERLPGWLAARAHAGRMLVALDFDGTLVDIAPRPDDVSVDSELADILHRLAVRPDTDVAIVSGRSLEDLRARFRIDALFYAGNHGLEIEGPHVQRVHPGASSAVPRIAACAATLRAAQLPAGVILEDKALTLSLHYRLAADPAVEERLVALLSEIIGDEPGLRVTGGKKILEVRPDVEWDKGRATQFLLRTVEAGAGALIPVLFIGDDLTDEDAFRALPQRGSGIIVAAEPPVTTAATSFLRSPAEVRRFLDRLAGYE